MSPRDKNGLTDHERRVGAALAAVKAGQDRLQRLLGTKTREEAMRQAVVMEREIERRLRPKRGAA